MNIFFIPARAGSKRVPGKNYQRIGNKPLVAYSIDFALKVASDDDIIVVSTDCPFVIDIVRSYNEKVFLDIRTSDLAQDSSKMIDVATEYLSRTKHVKPTDLFILLQPTTPFRSIHTFSELLSMYELNPSASSFVSVVDVDFFHPSKVGSINSDSSFEPLLTNQEDNVDNKFKKPFYVVSGSFYLLTVENLVKFNSFFGPTPLAVIESSKQFVNIDNPIDLYVADYLSTRLS